MPPRGYPGMCEQAERGEPVPCLPLAHIVMVQADLALHLCEALFHLPTGIAHASQFLIARPFRAVGEPYLATGGGVFHFLADGSWASLYVLRG